MDSFYRIDANDNRTEAHFMGIIGESNRLSGSPGIGRNRSLWTAWVNK